MKNFPAVCFHNKHDVHHCINMTYYIRTVPSFLNFPFIGLHDLCRGTPLTATTRASVKTSDYTCGNNKTGLMK